MRVLLPDAWLFGEVYQPRAQVRCLDHGEVRHVVLRLEEVGEMGERRPMLHQHLVAEIPALPVGQEIVDGGGNAFACSTLIHL